MVKYAFVFPGQGSQHIGMGLSLYQNFATARDVFDKVDNALNQHLFKLMTEGSEQELTLTVNAQPAIMAVSMATIEVLKKEFGVDIKKISYVAGHSLGEYSAACTAGVFSLEDTAKLLRLRGSAMQQAVAQGIGGMAAVLGLSFQDIDALVEASSDEKHFCVAANDNTDGQVVLSGHIAAIEKAIEIAPEFGAKKAVMLPVSAPFHSPLMEPAVKPMAEALHKTPSNDPQIPLISNFSAMPSLSKEDVIANLISQITGTVRWRETMAFLSENNVTDIIEIGPSKVLSNMVKRSYKEIYTTSVHTSDDLEQLANNL
ncbi:MAG: ACP S-malonyltransferase [Alphaproteobacteria bacterium]|nr:ACP S-malonyltransferase [Alphaproteobacteria bacterium]